MSSPFPFHGIFSSLGQELPPSVLQEGAEDAARQSAEPPAPRTTGATQGRGQVAVDIYEQDGYVVIKAPIAGVRLSDLDIEIADTVLTIRGLRRQPDAVPADQYYLQECYWGEFARSVTLPFAIDARKVRATFNKENVLKILIPKEDRVKIVRINEG
jgi:HSP20 family protein